MTFVKFRLVLLVGLIVCSSISNSMAQSFKGFVYDAVTKAPVPYAGVKLLNSKYKAFTNEDGYFSLGEVLPGKYTLVVKVVGYDSLTEEREISFTEKSLKRFFVNPMAKSVRTTEIISQNEKVSRTKTPNVSVFRLSSKQIEKLPGIGGEADIAQYLSVLPGVVSSGDQGGQLYFRGGTPVQNLTMLDGIIIYNPYHSIGLYSVFENDLIRTADVYTAGYNADYGSRTSGVLDVRTKDGSKNTHHGKASLGPFVSRLNIEGPIWTNTNGESFTYVGSIRGSYLDRSAPKLYPYAKQNGQILPYSFLDLTGKLTVATSGGSKASITAFNYDDLAQLGLNNSFRWTTSGVGGNFTLIPQESNTVISGSLGVSSYTIGIAEEASLPRYSSINGYNGSLNFSSFNNDDEFKYGAGVNGNSASFQGISPNLLKYSLDDNNTELFLYSKYRFVRDKWIFEPGFRLQYYANINVVSPEPRLAAKYAVSKNIRLKFATGLYSQNLISTTSDRDVTNLFNGFAVNPSGVFDSDSARIDKNVQFAQHLVFGVEMDINDHLTIDVEPYIKNFSQIININREKTESKNPNYIAETGKAYGIDLLAKYRNGKFSAQLGYSLAKVDRTYKGITYNPTFDRRHNVNVLVSYALGEGDKWEIDARWAFGSGFPFTKTAGFYEQQQFSGGIDANPVTGNGGLGISYGNPADYNKGRLPYYHRLDLSIKRIWLKNYRVNISTIASVTNGYNRNNIFYIDRVSQ